ncbi:glucose-1-phosphate cytidylyltransferase [Hyphomicrobium sp. D-2]|uniref:glucose-1-phosphate cytidylyltransferase n=1 Tax=Hyphomicrobium sp. D-2 TaxID=3041621 RepID=UPI002458FDBF|nr:glucose-1-phosphate cytidylyltransferase [Hyphomicrobium sp. D-2]MDH4981857.1 glucose-1-phosphate cytidylyltransferase [Hyphomicrobium sp. D-2]
MQIVILAGGMGTRLAEETDKRPKPMVEIGGRPIIWHIMKIYSHWGFNDFIICLGYKGYLIKEYFHNYFLHQADVTVDLSSGATEIHRQLSEPWKVTLVDTGEQTQTGGRLGRVEKYLRDDTFGLTYGDGVADVNIPDVLKFHRNHGRQATVTAVRPARRFGALHLENDKVTAFEEKPHADGGWINGGFFVLSRDVLSRIDGDATIWERAPMEALARDDQLRAYRHEGFWHPMDTLRDKQFLEELWDSNAAKWKMW